MESFQTFIVNKSDKIKSMGFKSIGTFHIIDVNLWFKSNNLTPLNMNEIRQFIFEEWLHKKITAFKSKIISGSNLVVVNETPTNLFIDLLKDKIKEILAIEFCAIILIEE